VKRGVRLLAVALAGFLCLCGLALADDIGGSDNANCPGNNCFGTLGLLHFYDAGLDNGDNSDF